MSNGSKGGGKAALVGGLSALGGFATLLGIFFYIIRSGEGVDRWQALGMLAVAVGLAFAVTAMFRFALSPLIAANSSPAVADVDVATRGRIAPMVLLIGSIAIVALAMALIITFAVLASQQGTQSAVGSKVDTLLTGVFSTVLPVVATWVGTVLAFYFGTENFRQAAQSTREALSDRLAAKKKISDLMIPYERIAKLDAENEDAAAAIPMLKVVHTMSEAATRIIVFNAKAQTPIYVIRSSTPPMPKDWLTSDYAEGPELKNNTVKNYLEANGGQNKTDATKFCFIGVNETADDALALMKREGVDDLFITKDGQNTSRVLGWVAAHDLLK